MTTENTIPCDALPMDIDLTEVEIGYPVLPDGLYRALIAGAEVAKDEADAPKGYIVYFTLNQMATSTKGEELHPGLRFRQYITLRPSQKNPDWDWKKNRDQSLARIRKAALGSQAGGWNLEEVLGKEVALKLKVTEYNGEQQNDIASIIGINN